MLGLMQHTPLSLPSFLHRAERLSGHKRLVNAGAQEDSEMSVREWAGRVRRLASALDVLDVPLRGRVGTFCANSRQHLELYLAVPCADRVLHTLNIRLSEEQLAFIATQAEDDIIFVDRSLFPKLWPVVDRVPTVRHVIVIEDGSATEIPPDDRIFAYEDLLANASPYEGRFVVDDENKAAVICYTSGTTGNPKGVVYSHRSTVLHAMMMLAADTFALSERDVILTVVPMFHANAWGLPYGALLAGCDMIFPGADLSPTRIATLIKRYRVTLTSGVPTLWMDLAPHLRDCDLSSLRAIFSGGAAVPTSLTQTYRDAGILLIHAWGMTELSPTGALNSPRSYQDDWTPEQVSASLASQGQPIPLVELRVVDLQTGQECPSDGQTPGELQAAGPSVARGYYRHESDSNNWTEDGWLRTGDVACIDQWGSIRLVDRTKDLIKSGGEWISSVDLEDALMAHPHIAEAAVIAIPNDRWTERPMACVVGKPGVSLTDQELLEFLAERVPKWWLPDVITWMDAIPKTSVGKYSKVELRRQYAKSVVCDAF